MSQEQFESMLMLVVSFDWEYNPTVEGESKLWRDTMMKVEGVKHASIALDVSDEQRGDLHTVWQIAFERWCMAGTTK